MSHIVSQVQIDEKERIAPELTRRRQGGQRALGVGCLGALLFFCAGAGVLTIALQSGPVSIGLPGGASLRVGSDNFVLSNNSFQNGTTFYVDIKSKNLRNILELHQLPDSHNVEVVLHQASPEGQKEQHLLALPMP